MAVVKIIELVGSSTSSSDDAVQQALTEARKTLRNIKAVDVVSTGSLGLTRLRARAAMTSAVTPGPATFGEKLPSLP